jgi:hypothetical protein
MIAPGTEAGLLRLRRRNPVIQVGLSAVRQIVGPFDRFKLLQQDSEDQEIYIEDEEFNFFSMSYEHSISMSMAKPARSAEGGEGGGGSNLRAGRGRGGVFRRKYGGGL